MEIKNENSITHFFDGRSIFITGGTGFMGKVLIEKLLRSCPGVNKIYVLTRPSRGGKTPREKLNDVFKLALFEPLRKSHSDEIFDKVHAIPGDVRELGLGISPYDRKLIVDNVSVIFHVAANVRFDDPIHEAVLVNTRGTREVVTLAKEIENIAVFVHVSTAFCNCNRKVMGEVIYPPPMDWKEAVVMAEKCHPTISKILSKKYIGEFPNTYVFTKNLSEQLIREECNDIPTVIYRPSIVTPTIKEPFPGWVDNFNGPVSLMMGYGKGIIRVELTTKDNRLDFVPADISIKGMITAAWKKATERDSLKHTLMIINSAASDECCVTQGELLQHGKSFTEDYPMDSIWIPDAMFTSNRACYCFNVMLKQVLPAIAVDWILSLMKKKPQHLLKIQRKIYRASTELSYFTLNNWLILNMNFLTLMNDVPQHDREAFEFDLNLRTADEKKQYTYDASAGGIKHLLNVDVKVPSSAITKLKWMKFIRNVIRVIFLGFVFQYLYNNTTRIYHL